MSTKRARALLSKYRDGKCSDQEKAIVERWLFQYNDDDIDLSEKSIEEIQQQVLKNLPVHGKKQKGKIFTIQRIVTAASILLFLSFGAYFLWGKKVKKIQIVQIQQHDARPGSFKATLTLSNGKQISLNKAKKGIIAKDNQAVIQKTGSGAVVYNSGSQANSQEIVYNTITTPRGGMWPVVLPDGSKVMLNAATTLRYPVSFNGNERVVELDGEAYFEVVHNSAKPFKVKSNGQTVEDLGTHFNINAYHDEPAITTTLLEGSVSVTRDRIVTMIKPGEEAVWTDHASRFKIDKVDVDEAVAWKNGLFQFDHASIAAIMRQTSRWYDVDVSYEGNIPQATFSGNLQRNVDASVLLDELRVTGIHFKIQGKKLTVTPR
jgi:ferric-dicitrate binding protein FerR (iron transport regulator)